MSVIDQLGVLTPGHRRLNWGWYYNVPNLDEFLTDCNGTKRQHSVPPGFCDPKEVNKIQEISKSKWPMQVQDVIRITDKPFIQAVYEFPPSTLTFGRVVLVGDAGHVAR